MFPPLLVATILILQTGSDSGTTSAAVPSLRAQLAAGGTTVLDAATAARTVGADLGAQSDVTRESALIDSAEKDFFNGDFDRARVKLAQADALQVRGAEMFPDRARLFFVRSMIAMKTVGGAAATPDLLAALRIDPDFSASTYPPDAQIALEENRAKLPRRFILRVAVDPPDSEVRVDGRSAAGSIAVLAGTHQVVARRKGLRTAIRTIEMTADSEASLELSPALAPAGDAAIAGWTGAEPAVPEPSSLAQLATAAGADAILVVAARAGSPEIRARIWSNGTKAASPAFRADPSGAVPGLGGWALPFLVPAKIAATLAPAPKPPSVVAARAPIAPTSAAPRKKRGLLWVGLGVAGLVLAGGAVAVASGKDKTTIDPSRTAVTLR